MDCFLFHLSHALSREINVGTTKVVLINYKNNVHNKIIRNSRDHHEFCFSRTFLILIISFMAIFVANLYRHSCLLFALKKCFARYLEIYLRLFKL